MGGWGSGRHGGRPTADTSLRIDLAWMLRTGRAKEGGWRSGSLSWHRGDEHVGSIGYSTIMDQPGEERLELPYTNGRGNDAEQRRLECFQKLEAVVADNAAHDRRCR